jgi:hypothetical protein
MKTSLKQTLKAFSTRQWFIALCFLLVSAQTYAQLTVKEGTKNKTVATQEWVKEYVKSQLKQTTPPSTAPAPPVVDTRPGCAVGLTLLTVTPSKTQLEFTFHSLDVQTIDYKIKSGNVTLTSGHTGKLTSSRVFIPHSLPAGNYTLQIKATNCKSDSTTGVKPFTIISTTVPPVSPTNPDRTGTGNGKLTPIKDPLLPSVERTGNYELRYIESRPDNHLDLRISTKNGQLYLTDLGSSLRSASYTLNGWTDLENCGKLQEEPIRPYRLYHLSKFSVDVSDLKDSWRAEYANPRADYRRSELFFYVVPRSETWNPVGESPNPIGRPAAFARIPPFQLKNRLYGFEYDLRDETDQRKEELSISFNWKVQHQKLYSDVLTKYLLSLPPRADGSRRAFHDLTKNECFDFANRLQIQKIMAFDIEPGVESKWIIDYDAPNFTTNMNYVLQRLEERGAKAYNWMESPGKSVKNLTLDNAVLSPHGGYGPRNRDILKYKEAYQRLGDLKKRDNGGTIINTGFGYTGYDQNFSDSDGTGQNISPQITYLKALDATELWSRALPEKEQSYFSWAFSEFDFYRFPQNHFVEIPQYNALVKRTDNKPLYPPGYFKDNLTLGLITAKYLFYWCPGPLGWNPTNTTTHAKEYVGKNEDGSDKFHVWTYEAGGSRPPLSDKFYAGKEAMALNSTIVAAYTFSQVQDAMDGTRTAPKFTYGRAAKDGNVPVSLTVEAITDGSWYNDAITKRQPFVVLCENHGNRALLVQDVWSRPGRFTDFEISIDGKIYPVQTEGNGLFVTKL